MNEEDPRSAEERVRELFVQSIDETMRAFWGLPPERPEGAEPEPSERLTVTRLYWDMIALGRSYIEVVREGKAGIAFYAAEPDQVYFIPHQEPKLPSADYVFEYEPSRFREPEPSVDVYESNQSVRAEFGRRTYVHINHHIANASVAYILGGDPTWSDQPGEPETQGDEPSSTPSMKPERRPTRRERRHPGSQSPPARPWERHRKYRPQ